MEARIKLADGTYDIKTVQHRTETVYGRYGPVDAERSNIIHNGLGDRGDGVHDETNVQTTLYQYDENGNVVRTTYNDGSFMKVCYDELGRKIAESRQVGSNVDLQWVDDHGGTFVDVSIPSGDSGHVVPTRLMSYDADGRLAAVTLPDPDPTDGDNARPVYQYGYEQENRDKRENRDRSDRSN